MKVLVIEDEASLLKSIMDYCRKEEFLCEGVSTYTAALTRLEDFEYDCVILDINLPGGSGLELLQFLRAHKRSAGVIIISARDSLDDKLNGLTLGADDYMTKPFHLPELNARIKALIRRRYSQGVNVLEAGSIAIDLLSRTVSLQQQPLGLTKNEYDLLLFMVNNRNRVVSKRAIGEHLFGEEADNLPSFDFIYSHIKNLKRKLKEKGADDLIQTVYGLGYKLIV
jgi:DNA-binding response OmpR family regulator